MQYSSDWNGQTDFWTDVYEAILLKFSDGSPESKVAVYQDMISPLVDSLQPEAEKVATFAVGVLLHAHKLNGRNGL